MDNKCSWKVNYIFFFQIFMCVWFFFLLNSCSPLWELHPITNSPHPSSLIPRTTPQENFSQEQSEAGLRGCTWNQCPDILQQWGSEEPILPILQQWGSEETVLTILQQWGSEETVLPIQLCRELQWILSVISKYKPELQ